ncbi:hypothetical protein [uncultured Thiodictyon sp.]|uniref:hypothetical protein n=1 Tax=uncultured Thiodictyon sp. TaxID=1846217 RepID=UPI0025F7EA78|nr:hypothetical protein [uncultured Thiodictyon sp.]
MPMGIYGPGAATYGQLGDGTTTAIWSPVPRRRAALTLRVNQTGTLESSEANNQTPQAQTVKWQAGPTARVG